MSVDLREQLRDYANAVVDASAPVAWRERDVPVHVWPWRAVALAAVGVATIVVAVVLATRPVPSGVPVIERPPTVVPSESSTPSELAPPTEDELLLGAVLEAADLLGTQVREFDADPGRAASLFHGLSEQDAGSSGASASDLEDLPGALVATIDAAFVGESVVDEENPAPAPGSGEFSLLAFRDAASASLFVSSTSRLHADSSLTDPTVWADSEDDPSHYSDPAAVRAMALGDEAAYYFAGARGGGARLLIQHDRFVFEVVYSRVPDVDQVAAAVFDALDSPQVPRATVAVAQVPALRGVDRRFLSISIVGDRGELGGGVYGFPGSDDAENEDFAWCSAPCRAIPVAVADLGLDLVGVDGVPAARSIGGDLVATRWYHALDDDALRPTELVGPDATAITGWVEVDGSRTWLLALELDYRAPAVWVAERFAVDLAEVAEPDGEVVVRIDYQAAELLDDA